ncbi:MAG: hypothetical protein PHI53_01010 [Candidatus Pacebacteria bacterium]|nr:hypothetical protein [Candidatus Paceibacterota bacterium]
MFIITFIFLIIFIPFSASCIKSIIDPIKPNSYQVETKEVADIKLQARVYEAEKEAREKQDLLDKRNKEYELLVKQKDKLLQERDDYPRDTPEDVVKENKVLRYQLLRNETTSAIGYRTFRDMIEDNRTLRAENLGLKRENQAARAYLEEQGIYLSSITGKETDITESPLYLEKEEHNATKNRLFLERAKREAERSSFEAQVLKLQQELSEAIRDRRVYKEAYEAWRRHAKGLKGSSTDNGSL